MQENIMGGGICLLRKLRLNKIYQKIQILCKNLTSLYFQNINAIVYKPSSKFVKVD